MNKKTPKAAETTVKAKQNHKPQLNWDAQEIEMLLAAEPGLLTATDDRERFQLIRKAQLLLPEHRRRSYESLYAGTVQRPQMMKSRLGVPRTPAPMPPDIAQQIAELEESREALKQTAQTLQTAPAAPAPKEERPTVRRWGKGELAVLAHDPKVKALITGPLPPPNPVLVEALMKAQAKHLPRARWRKRLSLMHSCHIAPGLLKHLHAGLALPDPHPAPEPPPAPPVEAAPTPQHAAALPPAVEGIAVALNVLGGALKPLAVQMFAGLIPLLEQAVARGVAAGLASANLPQPQSINEADILNGVRQAVIDILGAPAQPPDTDPDPEPDPAPERARLPRVDVVGLLGAQEEIVRRHCGAAFDLRFIKADDVAHAKITAPTAVMLTRFVKHTAQDRIKKSGAKLVFANGAADSVVAQLNAMTA